MKYSNFTLIEQVDTKLEEFWKMNSKEEFPNIPTSSYLDSLNQFMTFLKCCSMSPKGKNCLLPSKHVDSIWHSWLQMDESSFKSFCEANFRKEIEHKESKELKDSKQESLARCYVNSCKLNALDPCRGYIPSLFKFDYYSKMPFGYYYKRYENYIVHYSLDSKGLVNYYNTPPVFHRYLNPEYFFSLGLIDSIPKYYLDNKKSQFLPFS